MIRFNGSVVANYIEANENSSKKDYLYSIRICRKEAKESAYWLRLLKENNSEIEFFDSLIDEASQLKLIFNAILKKIKNPTTISPSILNEPNTPPAGRNL